MNDVQVFANPDFGQIRTVLIAGEPWFVGKDIAVKLGYADTAHALKQRIDDEDKRLVRVGEIPTLKVNNYGAYIINESGLYSLILSSKLPEAKKFKRWVTSEILPALRKTGKYILSEAPESPVLPDPTTVRVLTPDDYLNAARILSTCKSERLPYVLPMLERAGIDFTDIPLPRTYRLCDNDPELQGIEEFVRRPVPVNWNRYTLEERLAYWKNGDKTVSTVPRQTIAAIEIWRELLNQRGELSRADAREINRHLDALTGWKKYPSPIKTGTYGSQRVFVRDN